MASIAMASSARAELVYEENIQNGAVQTAPAQRVDERATLRQAIGSSQKAQATVQAAQAAPVAVRAVPVTVAQPAVVADPAPLAESYPAAPALAQVAAPPVEVQNLSKAELMRRERLREEMKNEDVLQERLEELRLRDERTRTEQLLGAPAVTGPSGATATAMAPSAIPASAIPMTEVIGAPASTTPVPVAVATAPTMVMTDQIASSRAASMSTAAFDAPAEKTTVYLQPHVGFGSINTGSTSMYDIRPHFAAGLGLGVVVSDNLSFEASYNYGEYGIATNFLDPATAGFQAQATAMGYGGTIENYTLKQNLIDAGLKLYFLGPDSRLRPFIGGGGAYGKSFINFSQQANLWTSNGGGSGVGSPDYSLSQFLGFLSTGLDIRVNKAVSIGAQFKYYAVLSSQENNPINNWAFQGLYGQYGVSPYNVYSSMTTKNMAGGSIANSSLYTLAAGVNFSF